MWKKKATLIIFVITLFLLFGVSNAQNYQNIGDSAVYNDSKVYFNITPRNASNQQINISFMTKSFTGNVNVVVLLDSNNTKPRSMEIYKPTNWTEQEYYTCTGINMSYQVSISTKYAWCLYGYEENVSSEMMIVFEHTFETYDKKTSTIYWTENFSQDWWNINDKFNVMDVNIDGKNKAYYMTNVNINAQQLYQLRMKLSVLPNQAGKYDIVIYPSSYGSDIYQAYIDDNLYYIDPWYDSNYGACRNITIGTPQGAGFVHRLELNSGNIDYAKTDGTDLLFVEGNCTTQNSGASALGHFVAYWNEAGTSVVYVNATTTNQEYLAMYYDSSEADISAIENTFYYQQNNNFENDTVSSTPGGWNKGTVANTDSRMSGQYLNMTSDETYSAIIAVPTTYPFRWGALIMANDIATERSFWFETEGGNHQFVWGINTNGSSYCDRHLVRKYGQIVTGNTPYWIEINITGIDVGYFYINGVAMTNCDNADSRNSAQTTAKTTYFRGNNINYVDNIIGYNTVNGITYTFSDEETPGGGGDTTPPTWSLNSTSSYNASSESTLSVFWQDDYGLDYWRSGYCQHWDQTQKICYTGWNISGNTSFLQGSNWTNFTVALGATEGWNFAWYVWVNDTSGNTNQSGNYNYGSLGNYFVGLLTGALDSCTYEGSGDWSIDCTDACVLSSNIDVQGNDITFSGSGTIEITATISNVQNIEATNGCHVISHGGGGLRG